MPKSQHVRRKDSDFVAKSIRDWEEARRRESRSAPPRRSHRSRSVLSLPRQFYGIGVLLVFMAVAAWQQIEPAVASLSDKPVLFSSNGAAATAKPSKSISRNFQICGAGKRRNCIVDGDTFWYQGEKIRIADIDTPEISKPGCAGEKRRGAQATRRLQDLLNSGSFEMSGSGTDRYGRSLRTVHRGSRSLGDTLVGEGLAHTWKGHKESWC